MSELTRSPATICVFVHSYENGRNLYLNFKIIIFFSAPPPLPCICECLQQQLHTMAIISKFLHRAAASALVGHVEQRKLLFQLFNNRSPVSLCSFIIKNAWKLHKHPSNWSEIFFCVDVECTINMNSLEIMNVLLGYERRGEERTSNGFTVADMIWNCVVRWPQLMTNSNGMAERWRDERRMTLEKIIFHFSLSETCRMWWNCFFPSDLKSIFFCTFVQVSFILLLFRLQCKSYNELSCCKSSLVILVSH